MSSLSDLPFSGLTPPELWRHFANILRMRRPSKHEEQLVAYIVSWAKACGYKFAVQSVPIHEDGAIVQNVRVSLPSSQGRELAAMTILQSHLDMVCVREAHSPYDPRRGEIAVEREGDWIRAVGTTLGADNGIGVAAMLAVGDVFRRTGTAPTHGPVTLLFTSDEEVGMTGVASLTPSLVIPPAKKHRGFSSVRSRYGPTLLNLDSEEEGAVVVGSAGGCDIHIDWPSSKVEVEKAVAIRVVVEGLLGGHSGTDIGPPPGSRVIRANAIKILARALLELPSSISLQEFESGAASNAIPSEASAVVLGSADQERALVDALNSSLSHALEKHVHAEPAVRYSLQLIVRDHLDSKAFDTFDTRRLLRLIFELPHGPRRLDPNLSMTVATSSNVAMVNTHDLGANIVVSARSTWKDELQSVISSVANIARNARAKISLHDDYPAWVPDAQSPARRIVERAYDQFLGWHKTIGIHAGLECGYLKEKLPAFDMVSFGPWIEKAHSPGERVNTKSVSVFWDVLISVLTELATVTHSLGGYRMPAAM